MVVFLFFVDESSGLGLVERASTKKKYDVNLNRHENESQIRCSSGAGARFPESAGAAT